MIVPERDEPLPVALVLVRRSGVGTVTEGEDLLGRVVVVEFECADRSGPHHLPPEELHDNVGTRRVLVRTDVRSEAGPQEFECPEVATRAASRNVFSRFKSRRSREFPERIEDERTARRDLKP